MFDCVDAAFSSVVCLNDVCIVFYAVAQKAYRNFAVFQILWLPYMETN